MIRTTFLFFALTALITSCGVLNSLNSNTSIKPNDSFILGNNEHGVFTVNLKNDSVTDLEIYYSPIAGGKHSTKIVKQKQSVKLKVDANTALVIKNNYQETATVNLKVKGDLGLSMDFNK